MVKKKKKSLINKIFGSKPREEEEFEIYDDVDGNYEDYDENEIDEKLLNENEHTLPETDEDSMELKINLIDKGKYLIAQAIMPGVDENDIDIDLNREMLTISAETNAKFIEIDENYLYRELNFGFFSRSILLPSEIDVDASDAKIKNSVLTIKMPKIDKNTKRKLSVKG